MKELFDLLDRQPEAWPRWQPGESTNGTSTDQRHLFVFIPQVVDGQVNLGSIRPACFWADGARPVFYNNRLSKHDSTMLDHCADCVEAELQHGLSRVC